MTLLRGTVLVATTARPQDCPHRSAINVPLGKGCGWGYTAGSLVVGKLADLHLLQAFATAGDYKKVRLEVLDG